MSDAYVWGKEEPIWARPAGVPPSTALAIRQEFFVAAPEWLYSTCPKRPPTSAIRIFRPKKAWAVSPRTVLTTGSLFHLFWPEFKSTVLLDDHSVGKIGHEQVRVFEVEPGEHRLCMRFVGLRRTEELRMSLKQGEERQFVCGTSGMGWPTVREASPEDLAEIRGTSISEPVRPEDPVPPNYRRSLVPGHHDQAASLSARN